MRLLKRYLVSETARCLDNGVRLSVIGRRDRLSRDLVRTIENTERITADGTELHLRLAVDYSARAAIAQAAARTRSPEDFEKELAAAVHSDVDAPVDLLIRTGGERRLSDFLLWECAYAELVFVDTFWPDFDEAAFDAALREFGAPRPALRPRRGHHGPGRLLAAPSSGPRSPSRGRPAQHRVRSYPARSSRLFPGKPTRYVEIAVPAARPPRLYCAPGLQGKQQ